MRFLRQDDDWQPRWGKGQVLALGNLSLRENLNHHSRPPAMGGGWDSVTEHSDSRFNHHTIRLLLPQAFTLGRECDLLGTWEGELKGRIMKESSEITNQILLVASLYLPCICSLGPKCFHPQFDSSGWVACQALLKTRSKECLQALLPQLPSPSSET